MSCDPGCSQVTCISLCCKARIAADLVIAPEWRVLAQFQLHVAERWLERGAKSGDPFARFFFYFAGVNALYYLWSKADDIRGRTPGRLPNEVAQIKHLLGKAGDTGSAAVLLAARDAVEYLSQRRPIERMDDRSMNRALDGDIREGRRAKETLITGKEAVERLRALGHILYLVRSNLVHGSKMDQGDDADIIGYCAPALGVILEWAIGCTRSELGAM